MLAVSKREPGYRRPSDAQLNATALSRRDAPFGEFHERSVLVAYSGSRVSGGRTASLGWLARHILREIQMESPARLHDHDQDGVGLRFSPEFAAYLDASPTSVDMGDPDRDSSPDAIIEGYFRWPNRATLYLMLHSRSSRVARLGAIVTSIVNGMDPSAAAIAYGAHPDDAQHTARRAMETFMGRRSALRIRMPKGVTE